MCLKLLSGRLIQLQNMCFHLYVIQLMYLLCSLVFLFLLKHLVFMPVKRQSFFFTGCTPNFDNDQAEVVLGKALHTLIYLRNSFGKVLKHIAKCACICQYGT